MSDIAINIAIIPPIKLQELAIWLSKNLHGGTDKVELSIQDYIPHITLLFWCIDRSKVWELQKILDKHTRTIQPLQIYLKGVKESAIETGDIWSSLEIKQTPELQQLYETIIEYIKPLLSYEDITPSLYYEPHTIERITLDWTKKHKQKSSKDIYQPHLSLWIWKWIKDLSGEDFISKEIGIFQIWRYSTCRSKVWESVFLS